MTTLDGLEPGTVVAERDVHLTRDSLVRYAGASGDFNAIHYRDDVARHVGLPGVLAHGMLTMGIAVQPVVDWIGDPARITDYRVRFTRPVVVDAEAGADIHILATAKREIERGWQIELTVTVDGQSVLAKSLVSVSHADGRA